MWHHHNIPRGSTFVGRSCLCGLLPLPYYEGWTWCSFSPPPLESYSRKLRELMVPQSSIQDLGQPSILLLRTLPLLRSLMLPTLSLLVHLHLHLLYYLPLHLLHQSLILRSQEWLVHLIEGFFSWKMLSVWDRSNYFRVLASDGMNGVKVLIWSLMLNTRRWGVTNCWVMCRWERVWVTALTKCLLKECERNFSHVKLAALLLALEMLRMLDPPTFRKSPWYEVPTRPHTIWCGRPIQ